MIRKLTGPGRTGPLALALAFGILGAPLAAGVALADDMTARDVLDAYVEALGGEEKVKEYSSSHVTGSFAIPSQGMSGDLTMYSMSPDKRSLVIELAGVGQVRQGYNGTVGWSMDPMSGPMVMEGKQLAQTQADSDFYQVLYPEEDYETIELVGKTTWNEMEVYELKLMHKLGVESTQYFSVDTGLQVGSTSKQETPMGEIEVTTMIDEYKDFNGLMMPTRMTQKMMGMEQVLTVETVEFDTVDESVFALPEEIEALTAEKE